jgi:hypothetical protein
MSVQRLLDRVEETIELDRGHAEPTEPSGLAEMRERVEPRLPHRVLVRREYVQRAPHRPQLDERALLPQGVAQRARIQPLDARE